jgi:hypothetical protein
MLGRCNMLIAEEHDKKIALRLRNFRNVQIADGPRQVDPVDFCTDSACNRPNGNSLVVHILPFQSVSKA